MRRTLQEWQSLNQEVRTARAALDKLEALLTPWVTQLSLQDAEDKIERNYLLTQLERAAEVRVVLSCLDDATRPIAEWAGNKPNGDAIYVMREPVSCYGGLSARKYFDADGKPR